MKWPEEMYVHIRAEGWCPRLGIRFGGNRAVFMAFVRGGIDPRQNFVNIYLGVITNMYVRNEAHKSRVSFKIQWIGCIKSIQCENYNDPLIDIAPLPPQNTSIFVIVVFSSLPFRKFHFTIYIFASSCALFKLSDEYVWRKPTPGSKLLMFLHFEAGIGPGTH